MFSSLALATIAATATTLSVVGIAPVLAKPPGASVLGEVTFTEGERSAFFTEVIIPLGGNPKIHYGTYLQTYGDIGGDSPAGNAGGYVHFSQVPIDQCGVTSFFGVTQASQATARVRLFCQF